MFCSSVYRSGSSSDELGDDDPIGWFEVEEEWDEVDVRMQQCRVAQVRNHEYPLVAQSEQKFLSGLCCYMYELNIIVCAR